MQDSKIELLAPAGSFESLTAAINSGADAVYLGGTLFSARAFADNFSNEELIQAVNYCKVHGVKIYVTINILMKNEELNDVSEFLSFLHHIGVDGVIIQDLGLWFLGERLKDLELHASTQMTLHNTEGIKLIKKAEAKRVVLARELSLEEAKEIKEKTQVEIEVFGHGALCFAYSGQCLMSSLIGGRSGNRGRCAGPCRLKYTLKDKKNKEYNLDGNYLLSTKDLCTGMELDKLEGIVDSLKLEGRLKKPEYVATVTKTYRSLLDKSIDPKEAEITLREVFNRDFTKGYLLGDRGTQIMGYQEPSMRGLYLGKVELTTGDSITIKLQQPLQKGDGIVVWLKNGLKAGTVVGEIVKDGVKVNKASPGDLVTIPYRGKVFLQDKVFKTKNKEIISLAKETYSSEREFRKQPLDFYVTAKVGSEFIIKVRNINGLEAQGYSDYICEKAKKRPLSWDILQERLDRLGNTAYYLNSLEGDIDSDVMVPFSVLNDTRRKAIEDLENKIIKSARRKKTNITIPTPPQIPKQKSLLIAEVASFSLFQEALNASPDVIYLSGENFRRQSFSQEELEAALLSCQVNNIPCYYVFPRILHDYEFKREKKRLESVLFDGYVVGNLGAFALVPKGVNVVADWGLNITNYLSVEFLRKYVEHVKFQRFTASLELKNTELEELGSMIPLEIIVHGNLPLMVSENCIIGSTIGDGVCQNCRGYCQKEDYFLKDRLGIEFPLLSDKEGRSHIFNSRDLNLIEEALDLKRYASLRLLFALNDTSPGETIEIYKEALENNREIETLNEELAKITPRPFTTGHYYRGVE